MKLAHDRDLGVLSLSEVQWCQLTTAYARPHGRPSDTHSWGLHPVAPAVQFPALFPRQWQHHANVDSRIFCSLCHIIVLPSELKRTPSCCFVYVNSPASMFGSCLVCMWSVHRGSLSWYLLQEGKMILCLCCQSVTLRLHEEWLT